MPCSDVRPGDDEREASARQAMELLCELMGHDLTASPDLLARMAEWWDKHQALDARFPR